VIDPQTTPQFWDAAHRASDAPNLTGSAFDEEIGNLHVGDLIQPDQRVLNIGVGMGYTTKGLLDRGCKVSICDISSVAFDQFKGRVEGAYLPEQLAQLPDMHFDLALSHLVAQHMSDEALDHQFEAVLRGLNLTGVFAIQFASAWKDGENGDRDIQDGSRPYFRSLAQITQLAERYGGRVISARVTENFRDYQMCWYVAHIMKKSAIFEFRAPGARHGWAMN
jgi:hypothetical protein